MDDSVKPADSAIVKPWTYRVHEVPLGWDKSRLASFLSEQPGKANVRVQSLAQEYHGRHQTATVDSFDGNRWPQILRVPSETAWATADATTNGEVELQIDDNFDGLTTLFMPPKGDHHVDVVAVCGLGGHAFGSFRNKNPEQPHMWLRDDLPRDLTADKSNRSMARVIMYGYESSVADSDDTQHIADLAAAFRESLGALGGRKPVIFIAHSLGGLIVKQVIISLHKSVLPENRRLHDSIYGIVFFGVPHDGMDITSLIPMVGEGRNLGLVVSLSHLSSQVLETQRREFYQALGKEGYTEVYYFYETRDSPTAVKKDGKWKMEGPKARLVTKTSATRCRPWEDSDEYICPISASHSDMVKFARNDPTYQRTLQRLRGLCHRALGVRDRLHDAEVRFLVPYTPNPDFVGREEVVKQIQDLLKLEKTPSQRRNRRLALYGLGGIGKTQIAIWFAYWIKYEHRDISVFWVHASSHARFLADYSSIAKKYQIPAYDDPETDILSLVRDYLTKKMKQKKWFMIIDNADDDQLFFPSSVDDMGTPDTGGLGQYIPDCVHGSILMTTRHKKVAVDFMPGQTPLEIASISEHEALDLIHRTLGHKNTTAKEASTLSNKLDRLPLALAQSLAYMKKNNIPIAEYIMLLEKGDKYLVDQLSKHFEAVGRDTGTPNAVAATWVISFKQMEKNDPLAAELISLMSLFDPQSIPVGFLTAYLNLREMPDDGLKDISMRESIGTLIAYSFIACKTDGTYNMHRLVHLVTRKWLATNQKLHVFGPQAVTILWDAFPTLSYDNKNEITGLLPHVKSVLAQTEPEEAQETLEKANTTQTSLKRGQLLILMGDFFSLTTQYLDAEQHALQGHLLLASAVGADHEATLYAVSLLLEIDLHNERVAKMEERAKKELRRSEKKLGPEHHVTLRITRALVRSYLTQNKAGEAEKLLLPLLELTRRHWGEKHTSILYCMNDLASIYSSQGRLDEARLLHLEVIDTYGESLGKDHPSILAALHDLGVIYRRQDQLKEAGQIFRRVVDTSKKVNGLDNAHTLKYMCNLATIYRLEGNVEQAAELGGEVWRSSQDRLGENHPETLYSMSQYAVALRELKRKEEATKLMHNCSRLMREGVLGPGHSRTRLCEKYLRQWENEAD